MNFFSKIVAVSACVAVASSASLRAQQREPVEGFPTEGVPILPENLDFAEGLVDSDFAFDVLDRPANAGTGGTVQGLESENTPALQGQGIALTLFTVEEGGQNLIHYHPRATELLYVITGTLQCGFTDTTGRYIENIVKAGQATVFPRALLHFQRNIGTGQSQYISMLNSENPGVMSFPRVLKSIPTDILAQAFRTPAAEIADVQSRVVPPSLTPEGVIANYDNVAGPGGNAPVQALGGAPTSPAAPELSKEELFQQLLSILK